MDCLVNLKIIKMVSYSKHKQSNSNFLNQQDELIKTKGSSLPSISVMQKKPAQVHGLTHLVEKKGNSIYNGDEKDEVTALDTLDVNPDIRIRSRRGPNQEMVGDYDKRGEHIYRWFRVDEKPAGVNISGKNWYIREDTFEFADKKDLPKLRDLSGIPDKRTRQSHVAVRFEVWYNDNYFKPESIENPLKKLDQSGHMVMKDYFRDKFAPDPYTAYEMGETNQPVDEASTADIEDTNVEAHDKTGIKVKNAGPFSTYKQLGALRESERDIEGRLNAQKRVMGKTGGIKPKGTEDPKDVHKRFNKRKMVEILVSMDEYQYMNQMFDKRSQEGGFYCFYLEARTELNYGLATRCLSVLEDISLERGMDVGPGHAKQVLDRFADLANVTEAHQGEMDV